MQIGHMCQPISYLWWPFSLGECIYYSILHRFEQFLLHKMRHLKLCKIFLKCKDNKMSSKNLKLQNANWSYVPTHIMPMTPFTWRRHIVFIPSSIWMIFIALDVLSERLQKHFEFQKQQRNVQIQVFVLKFITCLFE
jgi:hypothetical protein